MPLKPYVHDRVIKKPNVVESSLGQFSLFNEGILMITITKEIINPIK